MGWKQTIRDRIAANVNRRSGLTEKQRQEIIDSETVAAIFCTEADLPLMSAHELKLYQESLSGKANDSSK